MSQSFALVKPPTVHDFHMIENQLIMHINSVDETGNVINCLKKKFKASQIPSEPAGGFAETATGELKRKRHLQQKKEAQDERRIILNIKQAIYNLASPTTRYAIDAIIEQQPPIPAPAAEDDEDDYMPQQLLKKGINNNNYNHTKRRVVLYPRPHHQRLQQQT